MSALRVPTRRNSSSRRMALGCTRQTESGASDLYDGLTKTQHSRDALTCMRSFCFRAQAGRAGRVRGGACGSLPLTNPVVYDGRFQTYPPPHGPTGG